MAKKRIEKVVRFPKEMWRTLEDLAEQAGNTESAQLVYAVHFYGLVCKACKNGGKVYMDNGDVCIAIKDEIIIASNLKS